MITKHAARFLRGMSRRWPELTAAGGGLAADYGYRRVTGDDSLIGTGVSAALPFAVARRNRRARQRYDRALRRPDGADVARRLNRPGGFFEATSPISAAAVAPMIGHGVATPERNMLGQLRNIVQAGDDETQSYWAARMRGENPSFLGHLAGRVLKSEPVRRQVREYSQPAASALREVGTGLTGSGVGALAGHLLAGSLSPRSPGDTQMTKQEYRRRQRNRRLLQLLLSGVGGVAGYAGGAAIGRRMGAGDAT